MSQPKAIGELWIKAEARMGEERAKLRKAKGTQGPTYWPGQGGPASTRRPNPRRIAAHQAAAKLG
jgi:hypothetical protein